MKLRLYIQTTFREIKQSFGRFIAIVLIIFMGVLLFVGIKSVGPDLESSLQQVIDKQSMSDIVVQSTLGFSQQDKEQLESKLKSANIDLAYSFPVIEETKQKNLQIYDIAKNSIQNELLLQEGSLPSNADEIVVDEQLKKEYPLGSVMQLDDDGLVHKEFRVVGYVKSVLFIANAERGVTNIGDGQLHGFAYVTDDAIASDVTSIMYIQFQDLENVDMFSSEYKTKLQSYTKTLDDFLSVRKVERKEELQQDAYTTIQENETKLNEQQQELDNAKTQVSTGLSTIQNQKVNLDTQKQEVQGQIQNLQDQKATVLQQKAQIEAQYGADVANAQFEQPLLQIENGLQQANAGLIQIESGQQELVKQEVSLLETQATLLENQTKIDEAKVEIEQAKSDIASMHEATYITNQRKDLPGFSEYTSLSDRIDAIANAFPIFFFAIAILITFTTITRMIEENRKEIGTLKALGYHNGEIAIKYVLYALIASSIGIGTGVLVGTKLLPAVVFTMLQSQYIIPTYETHYWSIPILIATALSLASTLCSTAYVLVKDVREKPTVLLQPKAPKSGKRILLERFTLLWSRLSFQMKVTFRNMFRYKGRSILTISGIAGCCGLMVTGFGLMSSIGAPATLQFDELQKSDAIITMESDVDQNILDQVDTFITKDPKVKQVLEVYSEQVTFSGTDVSKQNASLYVLNTNTTYTEFFDLRDSSKQLSLAEDGAIISDRLAQIFDVQVGDQIEMANAQGDEYTLTVKGIAENYLGHNVYVSSTYYENVTEKAVHDNTFLVKTDHMNSRAELDLREALMKKEGVQNVTYMSTQKDKQAKLVDSLSPVVIIIILLSGTLAFVVLYNLTNINISERERELATLKVLGFHSEEVTMHIVRENIFFTIIGIVIGFGVGYVLTWFILAMASSDLAVFPVVIKGYAYAIAVALTIAFTLIVTCITHVKLKHIHMIEALKSVD